MKVVLFGGGHFGRKAIENPKYDVIAVIDNNRELHGKDLNGVKIISLEEYKLYYSGYKILISTRNIQEITMQLYVNGISNFDPAPELYEDPSVLRDSEISHGKWFDYLLKLCDRPGKRILEVGSRNVTGSPFRDKFKNALYIGFDYYSGENVDIVGDAHILSSYFDEKFDLIFTSAVFEHLAMPWMVSIEMIKLLNKGGHVFVETHYSYSSHERPWHFFQYSENALDVLFPEKFGMHCVKKGCSNLLEGKFSVDADEYLQGKLVSGLYCHSEYLGQKVRDVDEAKLDWSMISLHDVSKGTEYPKILR